MATMMNEVIEDEFALPEDVSEEVKETEGQNLVSDTTNAGKEIAV